MLSERAQRQVDRLLDEADDAIKGRDWRHVLACAQDVLALDPDNTDARSYLAAAERALRMAAESSPAAEGTRPHPSPLPEGQGAILPQPPTPSPQPPAPVSFCDGRYQVKTFLGEGGKKRVYLAHDTLLDREVAFALIKTDGLDDVGRERVRREAQAMGRLGAHPHVVSVFDLGEAEGQPYIVTELMGGGDVEGLIEGAEGHRVPLAEALRIADQVCQGLEFAHGKGIVHRDLKPGNVWLTADGTVKLGDFGLAVALDRSRLTQAGMMVGTVSYMPPEQAMGGDVTPRSDLYSLGAMLYELVTGRPPFVGDESVAIITQHLNTPPVSPSWHAPEVPAGLEALILRLLEKDAAKRPGSAGEVREALGLVGARPHPSASPSGDSAGGGQRERRRGELPLPLGEGGGEGVSPQSPTPSPQPLGTSPLYRRTFVGREHELRQLQATFDVALSGQGSLLTVVGEPGIGKTALCEQLATYVAVRGGRTLVGHCYEEGSLSLPYLAFVEAMRTYVVDRDPDGLRQDLGTGAEEVARIVSEIRQRLNLPQDSGLSTQHLVDSDEDRWRLLQAVGGFLRNASSVQPLLLVLEDLHWADRGTLDLLVYLSRNLQGARLLVVTTYRDIEVDRTHPLSAALAELRRVSAFDRVLLRGLSGQEVQRMLEAITGQDVPWGFAEAVHRQTEGNPLFVQEVIRYLAEEGLIKHEGGRWQRTGSAPLEMSIPEGLRDVIGKRLSRLSPDCNRVLTLASVIGRDFSLQTLRTVADLPEEGLVQALEEAVRVGVLEERERVGRAEYRYAHAFFRQTLYEEISVPRRLQLHQRVGRALETQYGARVPDHAAELADHFAHSSDAADLRKAVHYGEMAAQRSMAVFAYGEAARVLHQAIEVQEVLDPDDKARRCDLLLALAEALGPAGEPRRVAEEIAVEAFTIAEDLGDSECAGRAAELGLEALRRFASGAAGTTALWAPWAERLDRHAAPNTARRARADTAIAQIPMMNGRWSEGWALLERALAAARQAEDAEGIFRAGTQMSSGWVSPRRWPKALEVAHQVQLLPRGGASQQTYGQFLDYAWGTLMAAGERDGAEQLRREIESLAAHTQDAEMLLRPSLYEALDTFLAGDLERAVTLGPSILGRAEELGSPTAGVSLLPYVTFRPLLYLGRSDEALAAAVPPWDMSRPGARESFWHLGSRLLAMAQVGREAEARTAVHETIARFSITPEEDDTPVRVLLGLLETAVLLGDQEAVTLLAPRLAEVPGMWPPLTCASLHVARAFAFLGDREAARLHYERALDWTTRMRHRPELALTRLGLAELLLDEAVSYQPSAVSPGADAGGQAQKLKADKLKAEGSAHLDFAIEEFQAMKMQPALERALRHKGLLRA